MKITRRPMAQGTVGELQSAQASLVSPEEAAQTELVKAAAISRSLGSVADVFAAMGEVRAKEEAASAVAQDAAATQSLDYAFAKRPLKEGEDPMVLLSEYNQAQKKLQSDIRANLTTKEAQRAYDTYVRQVTPQRTESYLAKVIEKEVQFTVGRLDADVDALLQQGSYVEAEQRIDAALTNQAISDIEHTKRVAQVRQRASSDYLFGLLITPTMEGLQIGLTAVQTGFMPETDTPMNLTPQERQQFASTFQAKLDSYESDLRQAKEDEQFQAFIGMVVPALKGELPMGAFGNQEIAAKLGPTFHSKLLAMYEDQSATDDSAATDAANTLLNELILYQDTDQDWIAKRDQVVSHISDLPGLTPETRGKLIERALGMVTDITQNEEYKLLKSSAFHSVTGYQESMMDAMMSKFESGFDPLVAGAMKFQIELYRKAEQYGPTSDGMKKLEVWMREKTPLYRMNAAMDAIQKSGIQIGDPLKMNPEQMQEWSDDLQLEIQRVYETGDAYQQNAMRSLSLLLHRIDTEFEELK